MREYTNEEQLDRFAELLEPIVEIFNDPAVSAGINVSPAKAIAAAIKSHKKAVITVLAYAEGCDPGEYKVPDPMTLLFKAVTLMQRPELAVLFPSLAQSEGSASSGPVMESTEDGAV